ncbi:orotidine-5'-phosphate decarboxylase [Tepidiforma sp.]|uniref:orotidine-5'-phosphate decarboxylase n=1 Tax=Tepidiforma sp. TaxID=2682230 RepID=UPI002ADDFE6B|nr:orotidine-5'-phosphate decarboxylase [Tepidiforma sp.]
MTPFFQRLAQRSQAIDSLVCVGLDPDVRRHSVGEVAPYLRDIVAATARFAACYKPNLAFFEQWGVPGLEALGSVLESIPSEIPVIGDAKRGDIGSTAEAYARALFETWKFDAVTVNPYLGRDATEPFLAYQDKGVYLICRTSNPGASDFQSLRLSDGRQLFEHVATTAAAWAPNVGLVVGATAPEELRRVRELTPHTPLLVPGVGAQGGTASEVIRSTGYRYGMIVVNASRSIVYAGSDSSAPEAAASAARALRDALRAARDGA